MTCAGIPVIGNTKEEDRNITAIITVRGSSASVDIAVSTLAIAVINRAYSVKSTQVKKVPQMGN